MNEQAFLTAIGQLMDEKLQPIREDISELKDRMEMLNGRMEDLETHMGRTEDRLGSMENRVDRIELRLGSLETRMDSMELRMGSIENRMGGLENRMGDLGSKVDDVAKQAKVNAECIRHVRTLVENQNERSIKLLAEGHQDILRAMVKEERVRAVERRVGVLEMGVRDHTVQIGDLKQQVG